MQGDRGKYRITENRCKRKGTTEERDRHNDKKDRERGKKTVVERGTDTKKRDRCRDTGPKKRDRHSKQI